MKQEILSQLEALFAKHPMLVAAPGTADEIGKIESYAGFALPVDYRDFVTRFGGAVVGPYSVFGVGAAKAMGSGEDSVIRVTERFRSQRWPGCEQSLVVSMDHAGNPVTLDAHGCLRLHDHDDGRAEQVGTSFEDFLLRCLAA